MTTKASPLSGGIASKNVLMAFRPPAEAPIPTMAITRFCLRRGENVSSGVRGSDRPAGGFLRTTLLGTFFGRRSLRPLLGDDFVGASGFFLDKTAPSPDACDLP